MTTSDLGHVVVIGNLGIVGNRKLRKLLSKGPSHREQNNINWDTNRKIIKKAVRAYKVRWAKKEKVDSQTLDEWECSIIETVQARIDRLRKKGKNQRKKYVLSDLECKQYLEGFQKRFVLVPADKASNILVVCKKYYLDVLKELGTNNGTSPQTYAPCSNHVEHLIAEHEDFLTRQNIRIPTDMKQSTGFYWLPKIHKNM